MKRICATLITLTLALAGLTMTAGAADAAKVDRRPCVSRAEFRSIHRPMTPAQVRAVFDIPGVLIGRLDDGYYLGDWVDDGYWDSYYVSDGYIDDFGNYVDAGYWVDDWVDLSYWDDYATWVPMVDTFRTYKKCRDRNFDKGRGRVAINFDNYTSDYSGMRIFSKFRNNPWVGTARVDPDKDRPVTPQHRTPKPKPKPTTPAPHGDLKDTVVKY